MDISIVIPLLNEAESLPELHSWIKKTMNEAGLSYEIIFVDDGSTDHSWQVISEMQADNPEIRAIRFRRNYGKSAALHEGFALISGNTVVTMDADLQDSPEEIPAMHNMLWQEGYDLVSGWKKKRYDPLSKTIPTKLYNWATRIMSGIRLHDFNCGLKAYRSEVAKTVEVYGEMHRYIPVIAYRNGFKKIGEKVVQHQPRKYGNTKFGMSRFVRGPLDLLSISFVSKFGKRPMHFFGFWGALSFLAGFCLTAYILISKYIAVLRDEKQQLVADNPLFYLSLVALIIGVQLFLGGFLGEMISRNAPDRNRYEISERIGV